MLKSSEERTTQIVSDHHDQIAGFARESYGHEGRGVVQIAFPRVPSGTLPVGSTMMKYHTLDDLRRMAARAPGDNHGAILIRMLETYDPATQAVVTAAIEGEMPVSIKMKLERPIISDEPSGVH